MNLRQTLRTPVLLADEWVRYPLWKTVWRDHVEFLWYASRNWGDALNPVLVRLLSGRPAHGIDLHMREAGLVHCHRPEHFAVVGSTLHMADEATVVWGVGFLDSAAKVAVTPRRVCAVRGPLTAAKLRHQGIDCPDVFGDPALLFPRFYRPAVRRTHRLGVVPHYVDFDSPLLEPFRLDPTVRIVDIRSGIRRVMDELASCEAIASTSLHGLIMADAYAIPSLWIKLSDKLEGDDFKFHDYFASQGEYGTQPEWIDADATPSELIRRCRLRVNRVDLDRLLAACPFARHGGAVSRF